MIRKKSPLFKFKILGVFVNTLTTDDKCPVRDCDNLQFPIQMQLSLKQKSFSEFFVQLMEFISNFKTFGIKDDRDSQCISEITDCQRLG